MLTCQAGTDITETHEHLCHTKSIKVLCHRQGGLHAIRIHKIVYIPSNYIGQKKVRQLNHDFF